MPCGCGSGATSGSEVWVNVRADGTTSAPGTKSEAVASQKASGGYLKQL
jgi:hypothetical protein